MQDESFNATFFMNLGPKQAREIFVEKCTQYDPLEAHRAPFLVLVDQQMDRGSLCTFCVSKADRRKHSKFDRSGTVRRPKFVLRESRFDEKCIQMQIVSFQTLQLKKQSIEKYSSMIEENFEFGAWIPVSEQRQTSLMYLA